MKKDLCKTTVNAIAALACATAMFLLTAPNLLAGPNIANVEADAMSEYCTAECVYDYLGATGTSRHQLMRFYNPGGALISTWSLSPTNTHNSCINAASSMACNAPGCNGIVQVMRNDFGQLFSRSCP